MIERIATELALVFPGVPDERDSCIRRLTDMLQAQGLQTMRGVQRDGHACLCLHRDPAQFGLRQVRSMARAAGAQLGVRHRHERVRIDAWGAQGQGAPLWTFIAPELHLNLVLLVNDRGQPRPGRSRRRGLRPPDAGGTGPHAR